MMQNDNLKRIAMVIEFDGRLFHGWQRQDNAMTVQEVLETALKKIENRTVSTVSSGRTDTGVHAEAMLVHADVSRVRWERSSRAYTQGMNQCLPTGVVVIGVCAVDDDFHARFSCVERHYRYKIWNRSTPSALMPWRHWWMPRDLDIAAMQQASQYMIGEHDFSSFQASGCQAHSPVRNLKLIEISRQGWEVHIQVQADAFLYHMVRNIVGNLVHIGIGKWEPEYIACILEQKNRAIAAATAPAQGLYFVDAIYPEFSARSLIGD